MSSATDLTHVSDPGARRLDDGRTKLYDVEDRTFTTAGKIGVWTKADSVTQFDDLTVVTK